MRQSSFRSWGEELESCIPLTFCMPMNVAYQPSWTFYPAQAKPNGGSSTYTSKEGSQGIEHNTEGYHRRQDGFLVATDTGFDKV